MPFPDASFQTLPGLLLFFPAIVLRLPVAVHSKDRQRSPTGSPRMGPRRHNDKRHELPELHKMGSVFVNVCQRMMDLVQGVYILVSPPVAQLPASTPVSEPRPRYFERRPNAAYHASGQSAMQNPHTNSQT